jgi:sterol desaturase/sphingolipid hydroxylase (fatty acid hydroxylase superfamily)
MNVKPKNKGQAVFFESPYLEIFTKSHPLVIWGIFLPTSLYIMWLGYAQNGMSMSRLMLVFASGLLFWSFFEYVMHRYVFHWVSESPRVQKFIYTAHGIHHEYPRDKHHLFMPPLVSIVLAVVLYYVFGAVLGDLVFAFFPGFVIGYLLYGTVHYCIHAFNPPFKFMKPLWRYHHIHHYAEHNKGFGVSSPFWDHVFGTVPRDATTLKDLKARERGVES